MKDKTFMGNGELTEVRYSNGTRKRYSDVPNQIDIEKPLK